MAQRNIKNNNQQTTTNKKETTANKQQTTANKQQSTTNMLGDYIRLNQNDYIISKKCFELNKNYDYSKYRLKSNINATPYINDLNVEIYTIDNFLSNDECDRIVKIAPDGFEKSGTVGKSKDDKYRTSHTLFYDSKCNKDDINFLQYVENKICTKIKIPHELSERLQITYYNSGESYKFHMDGFNYNDSPLHPDRGSQRSYTFMIYLSDVEEGGATFFPELNKRFNPEKGKAVIWNNLNNDGTRNNNTTHTGECVVKGQKYIITKWFRIGIVKK